MIEVLAPDQSFPEFNAVDTPLCEIIGQTFDAGKGSLGAPQGNGISHIGPKCPGVTFEMSGSQHIPYVGYHPVITALDEQIVVE